MVFDYNFTGTWSRHVGVAHLRSCYHFLVHTLLKRGLLTRSDIPSPSSQAASLVVLAIGRSLMLSWGCDIFSFFQFSSGGWSNSRKYRFRAILLWPTVWIDGITQSVFI
jgi:hypothetical protein